MNSAFLTERYYIMNFENMLLKDKGYGIKDSFSKHLFHG